MTNMSDGLNMRPRVKEPESALMPGMAAPARRLPSATTGGREVARAPNLTADEGLGVGALSMPDTSFPGAVQAPSPAHWVYDYDPANGISRASYNGEIAYTGSGGAVSSWNTRSGAVVMTTADITAAGGATATAMNTADLLRVLKAGDTMTGPLAIDQASTGVSGLTIQNTVGLANVTLAGPIGQYRNIIGQTVNIPRWSLALGDTTNEGGSNTGSNFSLTAFTDNAGSSIVPLTINRATGVASFSAAIVNGPSDRTLKENIAPITDGLEKVQALQGVRFNLIATPEKREMGLIAQDVEPIAPEVMQTYASADGDKLALDYPKLVALLIEAVKTLAGRVEVLETAARGARGQK